MDNELIIMKIMKIILKTLSSHRMEQRSADSFFFYKGMNHA